MVRAWRSTCFTHTRPLIENTTGGVDDLACRQASGADAFCYQQVGPPPREDGRRPIAPVLLASPGPEQGDHQAAEHIAHTGGGHARIAGGVDPPLAITGDNDGAAALERDMAAVTARPDSWPAVIRSAWMSRTDTTEKPGGFGRIRGEDGGRKAVIEITFEATVASEDSECIGIEYDGQRTFQRLFGQLNRIAGFTQAGTAGQCLQIGLKQRIDAA